MIGFGNILHKFLKPITSLEVQWIHEFGTIYGTFEGNRPILTDPELIKSILVTDFMCLMIRRETLYSTRKPTQYWAKNSRYCRRRVASGADSTVAHFLGLTDA
ncbi:unnamed protein product [Oppiella nova]|uniref:Uncharacterized protein n=1 Tax=Oppiella nova TaxID=334625 RepID=A0A7R9R1M8_9ACAR|nr:unnamed protein product [Oppiella nova]CAG2182639.1 unnamed protein product [Oppiella nova]